MYLNRIPVQIPVEDPPELTESSPQKSFGQEYLYPVFPAGSDKRKTFI
jgi:hypothetical protein